MSRTIVFGGSGFFGPILLQHYPDFISVGRSKPPAELKNQHIPIKSMDDLSVLDKLEFDKVIFLIGNSNHHKINKNCMMGIEYNVIPLKKALHYFRNKKLKKFIAFTGALLYDAQRIVLPVDESQPINPYINDYVFSKYVAEELTKLYPQVPVINVRLSNIYGPTRLIRPDIIPTLMQAVLSPRTPSVWSVKPERDFIYAPDAAAAVVKLLETETTGAVNVGSGTITSVKRVVEIIERLSGRKILVQDLPVAGPMRYQHDISLLCRLTGWKPKYSIEEGLKETYQIMKSYANECRWWEQTDESGLF